MIEFKNVKLNIKNIDISNDISFKIEDKSVTCFIGNKNAGKSTILKLISGIYKNYFGEILINGVDIEDNTKIRIDIVHDSIENDKNLTVKDYLEFYGSIYNRLNKVEIESFIDEKLKDFSLMSYKHTNLDQLDKETFKLIDIIRILINDPHIILFDNLFFSDNYDYNETILSFLYTIINKKTLVFATRNMNYLDKIVDNIGILERGVLLEYGKKNEIFRKANFKQKIEVEIIGDIDAAINILNSDKNVINLTYDRNMIVFSIANDDYLLNENNLKSIENAILKKLIDNNIKVYSFKSRGAKFSDLFSEII